MATELTLYNQASELLLKGDVDFENDTIKLALVTSAYTYNAEHDEWADASGSELSDASYTAGGVALAGKTVTRSADATTFDATDATFPALSGTFRRGIIYAAKTVGGKTNPLLATILFDNTPANVVMAGLDFVVVWSASGVLRVRKPV